MSVTERQPPESDWIDWLTDGRCTRHLLFRWRAEHEVGHCNWGGVFYSQTEAEHALASHTCAQTHRRMNGMSILERYWLELDRTIDQLKDPETQNMGSAEVAKIQGRASGLAFAIVVGATPYFDDEKAVSKEALARWKMRNGQMDFRPTPSFKYNPPRPGSNSVQTIDRNEVPTYTKPHNKGSAPVAAPVSGRRRRATATPVEKQLTPLEQETIRKTGGAFPVKDLAKMYGVSEATIQALIGS